MAIGSNSFELGVSAKTKQVGLVVIHLLGNIVGMFGPSILSDCFDVQ